jgi:hypothetical protein
MESDVAAPKTGMFGGHGESNSHKTGRCGSDRGVFGLEDRQPQTKATEAMVI